MLPKYGLIKAKIIIRKVDLKKTWYLKTAIIEKEWIKSLKSDIWDGPKYLKPLTEFTAPNDTKFFWQYQNNYSTNLPENVMFLRLFLSNNCSFQNLYYYQ